VTKFQFCPRCGGGLKPRGVSLFVCAVCNYHFYQNSKPTASALIVEEGKILLGKRGIEPFKGDWNIPGGFLDYGEDPVEAAKREVFEETGLVVEIGELLGIYTDTYGSEKIATLNIAYRARKISGEEKPGDDLMELKWFPLNELPEKIAFKNDEMMLAALKKN
jgi:ADP-ribose pyrophosphatase YjhB (NUDIX family)